MVDIPAGDPPSTPPDASPVAPKKTKAPPRRGSTKAEMAQRRKDGKGVGGRPKGAKNKRTLEEEERLRLERVRIEEIEHLQAGGAKEQVAAAKTAGMKLMKDIAFDFARLFAGLAAHYQPWPSWVDGPNGKPVNANPDFDEDKFKEYAVLAKDTAIAAAAYQSPRLAAAVVATTMVTRVVVEGGMPDDFKPPLMLAPPVVQDEKQEDVKQIEFAPGSIISADDIPDADAA